MININFSLLMLLGGQQRDLVPHLTGVGNVQGNHLPLRDVKSQRLVRVSRAVLPDHKVAVESFGLCEMVGHLHYRKILFV